MWNKIALKYCGGCNPDFDRGEARTELKEKLGDYVKWVTLDSGEAEAVETVSEGLKSVLRYLGVLKDVSHPKVDCVFLKDWAWIMAPYGGRFVPTAKINDRIEKDQIIAKLYTVFDDELEPIKSPLTGFVLTVTKKPLAIQSFRWVRPHKA